LHILGGVALGTCDVGAAAMCFMLCQRYCTAIYLNMTEELPLDENARKAAGSFNFYMVRGEAAVDKTKSLVVIHS
jgi:hypothetical protein